MATRRRRTARPRALEQRIGEGGGSPTTAPGRVIALLGAGHAIWGALAYRRELAEIAAHPIDAVGDGLFNTRHARDGRAAAFWFMFAAPLVVLCGRLSDAALRAGDHRAAAAAGRTVVGISLLGLVVIPARASRQPCRPGGSSSAGHAKRSGCLPAPTTGPDPRGTVGCAPVLSSWKTAEWFRT